MFNLRKKAHEKIRVLMQRIIRKAIHYGLIRKKVFLINSKKILLTNINESNLLKEIAFNGFESYENEVVKLVINYPWEMNAFFDVGANIAFYSILTEIYHPDVKVVAVEPFPKNIEYIRKIKKLNKLNFYIVDKAVDKVSGEEKIFYFPVAKNSSKLSTSASLINSFQGTKGIFSHLPYETASVKTITLNELVGKQNNTCLIKLDCEGNELAILESSKAILKRDNVDFIIEIMINDTDKHSVFSLMIEHGYKGYLITNAGLVLEDRPLTFPYPEVKDRTIWKNHFFTKRDVDEVRDFSKKIFGYCI